jgi:hypothetical protein
MIPISISSPKITILITSAIGERNSGKILRLRKR